MLLELKLAYRMEFTDTDFLLLCCYVCNTVCVVCMFVCVWHLRNIKLLLSFLNI